MKHTIEFDEECESCKGTGLFKGFAEGEGVAVVCHTCKGTGCYHYKHTYDDFSGRKEKKGVKLVIKVNPGIGVGEGGGHKLTEFGGMSYDAWSQGVSFPKGSEMRKFTCPAWWYQSADYDKKPDWKQCCGMGIFSSCDNFAEKEKCWERWDKENK